MLFTDIVGSTELASRLGDRGWKDLLARHHAIVRDALRRAGGREQDTAGDGFFATFDRPARAIDCAFDAMDRLAPLGITIRAAVHMGEVGDMDGKVGGATVHVGARALQYAEAGRVVVTRTVRDVAAGSGYTFADMGDHVLKGLPGEWRLYGVERPERAAAETAAAAREAASPSARVPGRRIWLALVGLLVLVVAGAVVISLAGSAPSVKAGVNSAVHVAESGEILASVAVGHGPTGLALGGGSVWVLSRPDRTVSIVDAASGAVTRAPGLPGPPTGIAAGTDSIWITNGFGTAGQSQGAVLRMGMAAQRVEQTIPVGDGARGIAIGEGGVWVSNGLTGELVRIDEFTREVGTPIKLGGQPEPVAVAYGSVWVGDVLGRDIRQVDPSTGIALVAVSLADPPTAIAAGFDRLWVTSTQGNSLTVIDPSTRRIVRTLVIAGGPRGVAASGSAVWVAVSAGELARVDPDSLEVRSVLALPGPAEGVAAGAGSVWVTVQE